MRSLTRLTSRRCSESGGSGICACRNRSSWSRTRLVVPSLALRHRSTKSAVLLIHSRNDGNKRDELTLKTGKSFVTMAPSKSCGTIPTAPFRASIRDRMKCDRRATNLREPAISPPTTLPRSTTPFPHSLTVIWRYSAWGSISTVSSLLVSTSPSLTMGHCDASGRPVLLAPAGASRAAASGRTGRRLFEPLTLPSSRASPGSCRRSR